MKAAFIRSFEFAVSINRYSPHHANEESFFLAAGLRGICEDLIVLKFIRRLKRKDRDEVVRIRMLVSTGEAVAKQAAFFRKTRPFQPVIRKFIDHRKLHVEKDRLTVIGQKNALWNTARKLPPVEQMANRVNLRKFYDFVYAATSEIVHSSVRVALRSGWGDLPNNVTFSTKNFCRYYLEFSQFYSLYMLTQFCRTFRAELNLSTAFMEVLNKLEATLNEALRWPEVVTFEEMNQPNPNEIMRAVLFVAHQERVKAKSKTSANRNHESMR